MWRTGVPQWRPLAPWWCHPITWPAYLTTANRSAHNSKQNRQDKIVFQIQTMVSCLLF